MHYMYIYILHAHIWNLLECLIDCSFSSPTLTISCDRQVKNSVALWFRRLDVSAVPSAAGIPNNPTRGWASVNIGIPMKEFLLMPNQQFYSYYS